MGWVGIEPTVCLCNGFTVRRYRQLSIPTRMGVIRFGPMTSCVSSRRSTLSYTPVFSAPIEIWTLTCIVSETIASAVGLQEHERLQRVKYTHLTSLLVRYHGQVVALAQSPSVITLISYHNFWISSNGLLDFSTTRADVATLSFVPIPFGLKLFLVAGTADIFGFVPCVHNDLLVRSLYTTFRFSSTPKVWRDWRPCATGQERPWKAQKEPRFSWAYFLLMPLLSSLVHYNTTLETCQGSVFCSCFSKNIF